MSCADVCLSMDYDSGANDFYHTQYPTARKPHRCCECRGTIQPGERYERVSGKSDGDVWTVKSCGRCAEIRDAFVCGAWVFGELWEHIEEYMFPVWKERGPWDCLAELQTPETRKHIMTVYEDWKRDRD